MGVRSRLRSRLKRMADRFSGEYSAAAVPRSDDGAPLPSGRPTTVPPPHDVEITRPRIRRPRSRNTNEP